MVQEMSRTVMSRTSFSPGLSVIGSVLSATNFFFCRFTAKESGYTLEIIIGAVGVSQESGGYE